MKHIFYFLILIIPIFISCSSEKTKPNTHQDYKITLTKFDSSRIFTIDTFFISRYKKGLFNGVVLFAEGNKIIYKNSFGYADIISKKTLSFHTKFQLASISKQFTALAIMLLKKRGLLSYDDDIKKYLPKFPYMNITIRQLLTHKSGLPNYMYFADQYWLDKTRYLHNNELLDILQTYKPKEYFKSGSRYNYSNTGYCILASVVEKISNKTFNEFVDQEIFKSVGMLNTFVLDKEKFNHVENIAIGYKYYNKLAGDNYMNGVLGDKGIYSTIEDLFKWNSALHSGQIIDKELLYEALEPSYIDKSGERGYGFGFRILNPGKNNKIIYHTGLWNGFRTLLAYQPGGQKTIIVLSNVASNHFFIKDLTTLF